LPRNALPIKGFTGGKADGLDRPILIEKKFLKFSSSNIENSLKGTGCSVWKPEK
jgi:hypothetical protein